MALRFADRDAVRLALGLLPPERLGAPVAWGEDGGAVRVADDGLQAAVIDALVSRGAARDPGPTPKMATCWAELAGLRKADTDAVTEALLILPVGDLLAVGGELVRLGAEAIRWCVAGDLGLIRVERPPFWTLTDPALKAYAPASGVWAPPGFTPAARVSAQPGTLVVADPAGWRILPDGPWTDPLARAVIAVGGRGLEAGEAPRLEIRLRLGRGARRPATLWEVGSAADVEALVRDASDALVERLEWAFAGGRWLLRARGGGPPPELEADAAWAPLPSLPAVLLPVGKSIEPPLRRDALVRVLAPGDDELVLVEAASDGIRASRVSVDAFLPLARFVEYVLDRETEPLERWIAGSTFDFAPIRAGADPVVVADAPAPKAGIPARRRARSTPSPAAAPEAPDVAPPAPEPPAVQFRPARVEPAEAQRLLAARQREFLASEAPWDAPDRVAGWLELGELSAATHATGEAGACRVRAAWLADDAGLWWRAEGSPDALPAGDVDRDAARRGAAAVAAGEIPADAATKRWVDVHRDQLDLRAYWLAQRALADGVGGDPLGLATARDHVFGVLRNGLPIGSEVPAFVRFAGRETDGARLEPALEGLYKQLRTTRRQRSVVEAEEKYTLACVDLVFAWGAARLGAVDRARALTATGRVPLQRDDAIHRYTLAAFEARIRQALDGVPPETPLPPDLDASLNALAKFERYKVDRLRQACTILEPVEHLDPMRAFARGEGDPRGVRFAPLRGLADPAALAVALRDLLAGVRTLPENERAREISAILELVPSLPPAVARELLAEATRALDGDLPPADRIGLTGDALRTAAAADAPDVASRLGAALVELLATHGVGHAAAGRAIEAAVQAFRRLHLPDALHALLQALGPAAAAAPLPARIPVAGAWLAARQEADARPILDAAFTFLAGTPPLVERMAVSRAIARAVSRSSPSFAVAAAERLASQLPRVTDSYNTNSHFCISVIELAECLVLAVASDELGLGDAGRRFVDEDERILRRRIHADLAAR